LLSFIGVTDQFSRSKTEKRAVFECLKDIVISSQKLRVGKLKTPDTTRRCRDQADDLPCKNKSVASEKSGAAAPGLAGYQ